jgi:type IX secretion system PorP/SprF family membrane protein
MKTILLLLLFVVSFAGTAQQTAQSSLYFFNPLHFNPAYAGSRGSLNATLVHRAQWLGWDGAPRSQFLSVHAPVWRKNLGLGLTLNNDKIGSRSNLAAMFNAAYHLKFKQSSWRFSFGMSGGWMNNQADFSSLLATDLNDPNMQQGYSLSKPNLGAGIYAYHKKAYIGLSMPHLIERNLDTISNSYLQRHTYLTAGMVIPYNSVIDIKPSILLKYTANAPLSLDLNVSAFLYKQFWLGVLYRYNEGIGFNCAYSPSDRWSLGYAYELPLNRLLYRNWGSHEICLSFDLRSKLNAFISPRYF